MLPLAVYIGHRGLAGLAAENTAAAIRLAAKHKFRWIEIDARPAKDGGAFLSHDDSLRRCLGDNRRLSRMRGNDAPLPALAGALALAAKLGLGVVVEIKNCKGGERKAADEVCAVVRECRAEFILSAFSLEVLRAARRRLPNAPLAWNLSAPCRGWEKIAKELRLDNMHLWEKNFNGRDFAKFKAAGLGVYCFTVNDARRQQNLLAAGADGVFTDFPPPTRP